jgi:hypothetical protein
VKFHAPGIGLDVEGRDPVIERISQFVEEADVHYEVQEVVEYGPFVVALTHSTGTVDGQRMAWDPCQVLRYEGDEIAESWVLQAALLSRPPPEPDGSRIRSPGPAAGR